MGTALQHSRISSVHHCRVSPFASDVGTGYRQAVRQTVRPAGTGLAVADAAQTPTGEAPVLLDVRRNNVYVDKKGKGTTIR